MGVRVIPLEASHVPQAAQLFDAAYQRERRVSPLLPPAPMGGLDRIAESIRRDLANPCVAAFDGGELLAYLCMSARFPFKGQQAAVIREHGHASAPGRSDLLYRHLYAALGESLVQAGIHLHIICHLAGDHDLTATLFQLGFGAFLAERLRDLSPVPSTSTACIEREDDVTAMVAIEREHRRYYRGSPIFLTKNDDERAAREALEENRKAGNVFFVCRQDGVRGAYMIVGRCTGEEEGHLLFGTNSAQVHSAYVTPSMRGRGVGAAILQRCIQWAHQHGFERVLVEHETANSLGSSFWQRHFSPYLYVSMRYVDNRL